MARARTAAQRAALKKAQAASARKRRGSGRAVRKSNRKARKAYAKKNYKGAGGIHRNVRDYTRGHGAYAIGRKKKVGRAGRVGRRAVIGALYVSPYGGPAAIAHGVSYVRHSRKKKRR